MNIVDSPLLRRRCKQVTRTALSIIKHDRFEEPFYGRLLIMLRPCFKQIHTEVIGVPNTACCTLALSALRGIPQRNKLAYFWWFTFDQRYVIRIKNTQGQVTGLERWRRIKRWIALLRKNFKSNLVGINFNCLQRAKRINHFAAGRLPLMVSSWIKF